jgi:hypothetical protein
MALTVDEIREYVRDKADLNILLEGREQSSDVDIKMAMRLAISDVNGVAPVTQFTAESLNNDAILLYGTLHHLANMEAERQLRNQVNYSAQGLNAGIDDKMQQYNSLATYYKQLFDTKVKEYKVYLNAKQAWGDSFSPYSVLNPHNYRS